MHRRKSPNTEKLLFQIGDGSVRVDIIENCYGVCEVRPVRHGYSIIDGKTGTSDRFDVFQIDELIHRLEKAKTFLVQKSVTNGRSNV